MKKSISFLLPVLFVVVSTMTVAVAVPCACGEKPDPLPSPQIGGGGFAWAADYNGAPFTWERWIKPIVTIVQNGSSTVAIVTYGTPSTGTVLGASKFIFNNDLFWGSNLQPDMNEMQKLMVREGLLGAGQTSGLYDANTNKAVIAFQKKYNIHRQIGFFGPITRAFVNSR